MHSSRQTDVTRRSLIAAAAAAAAAAPAATAAATAAAATAAAAAEPAFAQQTPAPPAQGPPVWLDMDQKALDDAYDQSKYAPNIQQVIGRYATNSETARRHLGPPKRLSYGATPIEGADLYPTSRPNAPIQIFHKTAQDEEKSHSKARYLTDPMGGTVWRPLELDYGRRRMGDHNA